VTTDRQYVFISHANPEDNRFAAWLAARLKAEGYQPWLDLNQFRGGEPIWSTIEEVIRNHAAVVISIMSKSSYKKTGVLNEMTVAVTTQCRLEYDAFLIPIRLDDLTFGDFPAEIVRLNAVDFASDWAKGLQRLLRVLANSQAPCIHTSNVPNSWARALKDTDENPNNRIQRVCSNWFPIVSLPEELIFSRLIAPQADLAKITKSFVTPAVVRERLVASFASTTALRRCLARPGWIEHAYTIPIRATLHGRSSSDTANRFNLPFPRVVIRRIIVELLHKALAATLATRGLKMYNIHHDQTWYVPTDWKPNNKISFSDVFGNKTWRKLVGKARQYQWHFGISCRCRLDNPMRVVFRPRVIFTTDGTNLATGHVIMNRLRKRHCKNWWNADWRDRLQALSVALAEDDEHINVPLGGATVARISTRPMVYRFDTSKLENFDRVHKAKGTAIHDLQFIREPLLQFGHDQYSPHPRDGLFLFGPLDAKENPDTMRIGVVATDTGLAAYRRWLREIKTGILSPKAERPHHRCWPGFHAVFDTRWPDEPLVEIKIDADKLFTTIRYDNRSKALYEAVGLFAKPIQEHIRQSEAPPSLWFIVVPDDVYRYGRESATIPKEERVVSGVMPHEAALRDLREGQHLLFPDERKKLEIYQYEPNFRHQLKARLLKQHAVLQLVRESTLTSGQVKGRWDREDPATVAWNLCTTSFFKASGKPWKVGNSRPGVCYVGLVYKREYRHGRKNNACCGAQMFMDSGDGLVFRGAVGPWYSTTRKEFHLNRNSAEELMELVVNTYRNTHGTFPTELFIHGKTRFDDEEWKGFTSVVSPSTKLIGVRLRPGTDDIRLFTDGTQAVLRGTVYAVNDRRGYLWTTGYTPYLRTYPGWEVPRPVLVDICRGNADLLTVMKDIMVLTKLNFNSSVFADGKPVTLRFADAVGEVLTAAPVDDLPPLPFRHYI